MGTATRLKRDNHFLPVCYQKGFADSSGKVWVKFADRETAVRWHPSRIGKQRDLYIRTRGGVEDDNFEDYFDKQVENDFARFSQRVKRERIHLSSLTGKELGALGKFVAAQIVRTCANKQSMGEQMGRPLSTNEFLSEMTKQMKAITSHWTTDPPSFDFYSSLPGVEERFITGDDPVLLIRESDNPIWTPTHEPQLAITNLQELLTNPKVSFRVALSPYICVYLRAHGGGEARLPPQALEASEVRWFNNHIRRQCNLFTLARDEESLA